MDVLREFFVVRYSPFKCRNVFPYFKTQLRLKQFQKNNVEGNSTLGRTQLFIHKLKYELDNK